MKNPKSVLRATTAMMVALSFVGSHAAAGAQAVEFQIAQATVTQPTEEAQAAEQPQNAEAQQDGEAAVDDEAAVGDEAEAEDPAETAATQAEPEAEAEAQPEAEAEAQPEAEAEAQPEAEAEAEAQPEVEAEAQPAAEAEAQATDQTEAADPAGDLSTAETEAADETEAAAPAGDLSSSETPPVEGESEATVEATEQQPESAQQETAASGTEPADESPTQEVEASDVGVDQEVPETAEQEAGAGAEPAGEAQPGAEAAASESGSVPQTGTDAQASEAQASEEQPAGDDAADTATGTDSPSADAEPAATAETEAETDAQAADAPDTVEQPTAAESEASEAAATSGTEATADETSSEAAPAEAGVQTDAGTGSEATETQATGTQTEAEVTAEGDEAVTEQEVEEAAASGEDVVVGDTTTTEDLERQLEELRQQNADLEAHLQGGQALEVEEEVVTDETARSATEEVQAVSEGSDEDDDNQIWKYLGAAAGGAVVGALVPALGGRLVQDQGDRVIVERDGEFYVRKDETQLLRQPGARVQTETFDGGITRQTVTREDGSQVVTVRNPGGFVLRRTRITPDGQEIVLLEQTPQELYDYSDWDAELPPATAHRAATVDYDSTEPDALRQALVAQQEYQIERSFPLQAVREVEQVRELVPAVDLPINFATGSAAILPSEVEELTALGRMMADFIEQNPREIFLVEGHTDAVGTNITNLALSDRRAEAVALALTEYFDVPPENLVVQGYGERFLKEQTEGPSEENRRATIRRITPLIDQVASR